MDLGFDLQILFLQEVQFVRPGPAGIQLLLQHGLSLQQDLVVLLQLLQKPPHQQRIQVKQQNINTIASPLQKIFIITFNISTISCNSINSNSMSSSENSSV